MWRFRRASEPPASLHVLQRAGLIRRMQSYTWAEMLENAARRRPERITLMAWREG